MAPSQSLSLPSRDPLPHSLRLPSDHPTILKTLSRLSRASLLKLAQEWCSPKYRDNCGPYLNEDYEVDDTDLPWSAVNTIEELVDLYGDELASRKGAKRELLDRILEGDWRHGISLQQLAMADCQALLDHPTALAWTAFKFIPYQDSDEEENRPEQKERIPHVHVPSMIVSLHHQVAGLAKAHYHTFRPDNMPVTIIRIVLFDTPYSDAGNAMNEDLITASKSLFLAFPDGAPFVYVSLPALQTKETEKDAITLQSFIVKALPAAISQPLDRYEMKPTQLTTRSLEALLDMRGFSGDKGVGGGWSTYADDKKHSNALHVDQKQLELRTENQDEETDDATAGDKSTRGIKRAFEHSDPTAHIPPAKRKHLKALADGRFGQVGTQSDKKVLTRFNVQLKEPVKDNPSWRPSVHICLQGSHVFSGLRKLTEAGVIDAKSMPSWMTGEANVSTGSVKNGRISFWDDFED